MVDEFKLLGREEILAHIPAPKSRVEELENALLDVLPYCPEYMHGVPKKYYEKIARKGKGND